MFSRSLSSPRIRAKEISRKRTVISYGKQKADRAKQTSCSRFLDEPSDSPVGDLGVPNISEAWDMARGRAWFIRVRDDNDSPSRWGPANSDLPRYFWTSVFNSPIKAIEPAGAEAKMDDAVDEGLGLLNIGRVDVHCVGVRIIPGVVLSAGLCKKIVKRRLTKRSKGNAGGKIPRTPRRRSPTYHLRTWIVPSHS